jgi:transposase-like protein
MSLAHTTIMRWVPRHVPEFEKAVEPLRASSSRIVARRPDLRQIKARRTYLCRAVDKAGKTVDFLLRAKQDVAAAKAFFRWAFKNQGRPPRKIALEGYQASRRAAQVLEQPGARRL